ncbi:DUF2267 domain-containing protein [Streptomyces sp. DSM 42041]|uniref:DUF2267 domain-containing protein n=1 Tax=Streptomyces hazeniae TaxID=3075538 RepID=A0ABU2NR71_9ACTN|nr:DUF2267 domain-containing protein [Streptomyces sp. DSM 42041]MDT0379483.1 DUF2267 domain-containing protein [Streptomyces sp. DSM 42041]
MRDDEFLAHVRDHGQYEDQKEARTVTEAVLTVLAARVTADEAGDVAAQLPPPLDEPLRTSAGGERFDLDEFYRRVDGIVGPRSRTAEWDATAVLSTLPQAISPGAVRHLVTQLPDDFAPLFNRQAA